VGLHWGKDGAWATLMLHESKRGLFRELLRHVDFKLRTVWLNTKPSIAEQLH
jgi:hypothetical protein